MRLGDLDALKKAVDTWDKFGYTAQGELIRLTEENKDLYVPYVKYQDIENCIDNAPTVEPETKLVANVTFNKEQREELVEKAKADILSQIERSQGEWIPVSERLPEQNGLYITTCRDICENRVHAVVFDGVCKKWGRGGVIAWQPLPEPYKKGGAE